MTVPALVMAIAIITGVGKGTTPLIVVIALILVPNARRALADLSAAFYGHPSKHMAVVGITGTDGKTSTTHLLSAILEARGLETGWLTTVNTKIAAELRPNAAEHTTPEAPVVQRTLAEMLAAHVDVAAPCSGVLKSASRLPSSSKHLLECYERGAERFGWARRSPQPRSMRAGHELIGYGVATATYPALRMPAQARVRVEVDGTVEVATAAHDLGTGLYTILAQIAADARFAPAIHLRALGQDVCNLSMQRCDVNAELVEHEHGHTFCILEERRKKMFGVDFTSAVFASNALSSHNGCLCSFGELVEIVHVRSLRPNLRRLYSPCILIPFALGWVLKCSPPACLREKTAWGLAHSRTPRDGTGRACRGRSPVRVDAAFARR